MQSETLIKIGVVMAALALTINTGSANSPALDTDILKRGVSLSHWLNYWGRQPVTSSDMQRLKSAGFDHVRLTVDPVMLGWRPELSSDNLKSQLPMLQKLDDAIAMAHAEGLTAVIDFHPGEAMKKRIEDDANTASAFAHFWKILATHYAEYPENVIVYEVLNEPSYWTFLGPEAWLDLRARTVSAIREVDTKHLVLVSGSHGGGIKGLLADKPLKDDRIAYTVHYYEPMLLTHLGAHWEPFKSGIQGKFSGLRYPASSTSELKVTDERNRSKVEDAIRNYQAENWGYERILKDFRAMEAWGTANNARIICGEFGILRTLDPGTRSAWLHDVRMAAETTAMGWTVWDYADLFGIADLVKDYELASDGTPTPMDREHTDRKISPDLLLALGLNVDDDGKRIRSGEVDPGVVEKYSPSNAKEKQSDLDNYCRFDTDCPPTYACRKKTEFAPTGGCYKPRQ